jgi:hypothetical protein
MANTFVRPASLVHEWRWAGRAVRGVRTAQREGDHRAVFGIETGIIRSHREHARRRHRGRRAGVRVREGGGRTVGENPPGSNCTKYSSACEAWCAHFATWAWRKAGSSIPNYGFTGDIYTWGQNKGRAHNTNTGMQPGDIVLYGTGPQNTDSSVHTGVVVATGDGTITTIEGNSKNAVRKIGPFDPKHAKNAGLPGNIYGWVSAV